MSRSSYKGPFIDERILKKISLNSKSVKKAAPIKVYQTQAYVTPECVGISFSIYNGKKHIDFMAKVDHVGHRFGEFIQTRVFPSHMYQNKTEKDNKGGGKPTKGGGKNVKSGSGGGKSAPKSKK